jgi:signal transduction histidine kinase
MIEERRFTCLYEIMRLFLREPATVALGEVFRTLATALPLADVVLIREEADGPHVAQFHTAGSPPSEAGLSRACESYGWLAHYDERRLAELSSSQPSRHPTLPPSGDPGIAHFIVLPLVAVGQVFGALQIDSTTLLDEADLRFFDAVTNALALALDREQARRRQDQLLATAQAAVRSRDLVLAMVSHDLGSMITGVILQAALGLNKKGSGERSFSAIRASANRMKRLIRDLVDAATLESGKLSVERRACAVPALLAQALESMAADAREREVTLKLTSAELPTIEADGERVLQVLSNLLSNAIKLSPKGSTICLGAERVAGEIRISVSDRGPGIRRADLARVFEREWRAAGTSYRGRGLGLFIARGIVEAHGGRIWVESEEGQGATFLFSLPTNPS